MSLVPSGDDKTGTIFLKMFLSNLNNPHMDIYARYCGVGEREREMGVYLRRSLLA